MNTLKVHFSFVSSRPTLSGVKNIRLNLTCRGWSLDWIMSAYNVMHIFLSTRLVVSY